MSIVDRVFTRDAAWAIALLVIVIVMRTVAFDSLERPRQPFLAMCIIAGTAYTCGWLRRRLDVWARKQQIEHRSEGAAILLRAFWWLVIAGSIVAMFRSL